MSAIARRVAALEQSRTPEVKPLLILTLHWAGNENAEPLSIDGLSFEREPGEPWDTYRTRAVLWFEKNQPDNCVCVLMVRYRDDMDSGL